MAGACGKCALALDNQGGYAKCLGCKKQFHFGQCSVSSATWRAKSQQVKDEWRCEVCRGKLPTPSAQLPLSSETVNTVDASSIADAPTKSILDAVRLVSQQLDDKCNSLKNSLKAYSNGHYVNIEKLVQGLSSQLNDVKMDVQLLTSANAKLSTENESLRGDLQLARNRIGELELKMQCSSTVSLFGDASAGNSAVKSNDDGARVTMLYNKVVTSGVPNSSSGTLGSNSPGIQSSSHVSPSQTLPQRKKKDNQVKTTAPPLPQLTISSPAPAANGQPDGWNTVQSRRNTSGARRKSAKIGTRSIESSLGSQSQCLPTVKPFVPRVRKAALFVSRFAPSVSSRDIEEMIRGSVTLSELKVTKLKTRHTDYSSFHVEVLSSDLNKIDDVNVWPNGCLMKVYYGALISDVIVNENASTDNVVNP